MDDMRLASDALAHLVKYSAGVKPDDWDRATLRTTAWHGFCRCGWRGPVRDVRDTARQDLMEHRRRAVDTA